MPKKPAHREVVSIEVLAQDYVKAPNDPFLTVCHTRLVNCYADGSRSRDYTCDYVDRPKGLDAVVVLPFRHSAGRTEVLLRDGLRPPLALGRKHAAIPLPDRREYLFFREAPAGIIEADDHGEPGIRARAIAELREETGYDGSPDALIMLGAGSFPSAGTIPEKWWFLAIEIEADAIATALSGDGSPMEEGAQTHWQALDTAIEACLRGDIEDAKTELILRRLAAMTSDVASQQ